MKPRDMDGLRILSGPGPQRFEVWEPRWWQLGRWLHWWKFRRYHGYTTLTFPNINKGGMRTMKLRIIPSRMAAHSDATSGHNP